MGGGNLTTLVLGLGNPSLSDDSLGFHVASLLRENIKQFEITIVQASVAGLDVLELLAGYDKAIIIDAIQTGAGQAGRIYRFKPQEIAAGEISTPHDINFITALELGYKLGLTLPPEIVIFAIEAGDVTSCQETCSQAVNEAIPVCADMVIQELQR
jgi:hydrogenase maturation protease